MNYEVNDKTLAIIPDGTTKSKIIAENRTYNVNKSSFKVIEHSCEYFGDDYKSRLERSRKFVNTKYKTPIVIEETSRLIFFPITSPTKRDSVWLNYSNILDYYPCEVDKNITIVVFKNRSKIEIPATYYSFNSQFLKASRLSAVLADRITNLNKKS